MEELQAASAHSDERELLQLLSTPHLRAMLMVHDTVAQKNFDPVLPPLPDNIEEDFEEESVKIVRLVKNKEPLGATIRRDEHSGAVVVARIMRGGAADRSGPLAGIHHPENHPSHPGGGPLKGEQGVHAGPLPLQPSRGQGHSLPGGRPALPAQAGPGGGESGRPHVVAGQASRRHQPSSWPYSLQAVPGKATKLPESHRHPAEPPEPQEAHLDLRL
uniref:MAGUK p55 scaffold protein 3 n=1 Tax=Equus caballus TaxID=9796 RepID=A0A5F5PNW9_HORSE